ncbi:MerR family transcriptional regulator [Streptomyces roseoverticillatus]|uniref:MerR family transcriptional regulator n=1 Tax=Streptomyces roseoverticillatus TaxID=66429 RepID=A0ABV3IX02_9ACTN
MNGDTLHSIGDLARRTGLTVKTIRFYSDCGIVVPTDRSPAGYRLYDIATVTRLDLVRTLRDLGLDVATIRKVVDQELSLPERARGDMAGGVRRDLVAAVRDQVGPALLAGIAPASPQADPTVAALTAHYAHIVGRPADLGLRRQLLARLETANEPRRQRYTDLLAVVNGWPAPENLIPVLEWPIEALRARVPA